MVDKILNFSKKIKTKDEILDFENEIIRLNNARYIYLFARYIDGADINRLSDAILNTNDKRYIHFFIRSIRNINYEKFINKIVKFDDAKVLFNIIYDTILLDEKYIIRLTDRIYELSDYNYLYKSLYYYFKILKLSDSRMYNYLNDLCLKFNADISLNNIDDELDIILNNILKNFKVDSSGFSKNCYEGRNNMVPDIIVCHITSNFEKGLSYFYDKKKEVSSHYIIARDGRVKQVVDLKNSSWANGTSCSNNSDVYYKFSTSDIIKNRKMNANYYTFSIEHESYTGELTEIQYQKTIEVMVKIIKFLKTEYNYDFIIDRKHIIGHDEVNPIVRTMCPGYKFPFDKIINDLNVYFKKNS